MSLRTGESKTLESREGMPWWWGMGDRGVLGRVVASLPSGTLLRKMLTFLSLSFHICTMER